MPPLPFINTPFAKKTSSKAKSQHGHLLRILGVGFGLAVIVGNTIGGGIFRTPGDIAALLPNKWLFLSVWLVGGLYALLGSIQIAELRNALRDRPPGNRLSCT